MYETAYAIIGGLIAGVAFVIFCRLVRWVIDQIGARQARRRHYDALALQARRVAVERLIAEKNARMRNYAHEMDCTPLTASEERRLHNLMKGSN